MIKKRLALVFLSLFLFIPVLAQSNKPKQNQDSNNLAIKAEKTVSLDVQVLNKNTNTIVNGLTENDFEVYEDNIKQTISNFSQDKTPLSVLLLIDVSSKVDSILPLIKNGTSNALQSLKAEDEVGVMLFATSTATLKSFSKDKTSITNTIEKTKLKTVNFGKAKYLSEALHDAALHMEKYSSPNYHRVVIVITDNIIDKLPDGYTTKETVNKLLEVGVTVSAITVNNAKTQALIENQQNPLATPSLDKGLFQPVSFQGNGNSRANIGLNTQEAKRKSSEPFFAKPSDKSPTSNLRGASVEAYVRETGGEVIDAREQSFSMKCSELVQHLRNRYSISYNSSNAKNNGKLKKVTVKLVPTSQNSGLNQSELEIKTKKGYFIEMPEENSNSN